MSQILAREARPEIRAVVSNLYDSRALRADVLDAALFLAQIDLDLAQVTPLVGLAPTFLCRAAALLSRLEPILLNVGQNASRDRNRDLHARWADLYERIVQLGLRHIESETGTAFSD